jgi:hypothetical protein
MIAIAQRFRWQRRATVNEPVVTGSDPFANGLSIAEALEKLDADEQAARVPTFTPHLRPTAPQQALRERGATLSGPVPAHSQVQSRDVLRRVRDALARGTTPVGDHAASVFPWTPRRLPQIGERRSVATQGRIARYYPEPGGDYAGLYDAADRITGTTGPRLVFAYVITEGIDDDC